VREKTAYFLIATDFAGFPSGLRVAVQRQSTNLSTDFCGYRKIDSIGPPEYWMSRSVDAVRKLAGAQRFG
jgi:hypothetical protein